MKPQEFYKELSKGKIAPYYYFHGEELLAREACEKLIDKALAGGDRILNLQVFYAGEAESSLVVNSALEFPFLAPRRVVWLKQAEKLKVKEQEIYISYLSSPSPQTCLIFWAWEKPDLRGPLPKFFQQKRLLPFFPSLTEEESLSWIKERVKAGGGTIAQEAAEFLYRNNDELLSLKHEIDKVMLFAGENTAITLAHAEASAVDFGQADIYNFTRSLVKGNYGEAEKVLMKILPRSSDKELLMIFGSVLWQLRRMIKIKELLEAGVTGGQMAGQVRMNPAEVQRMAVDVKAVPWHNLHNCLQEAAKADLLWKRGGLQPSWALSFLAYRRAAAAKTGNR